MKIALASFVALVLSISAAAEQQGKKTVVYGHELGETFAQFATEVGYPGDTACLQWSTRWYAEMRVKSRSTITTESGSSGESVCDQYRAAATGGDADLELPIEDISVSSFVAHFVGRKMVAMHIAFKSEDFNTVSNQLEGQYGQVASSGITTVQNRFGVPSYELCWLTWSLPDGAVIDEEEAIDSENERYVKVEFFSGEYIKTLKQAMKRELSE